MDRRAVTGEVTEVSTIRGSRLGDLANEEIARADRELEGLVDAGKLVSIEQRKAGERRRDRVGTRSRVEEHAGLDVEVVAPARLGKSHAAKPGQSTMQRRSFVCDSISDMKPLRAYAEMTCASVAALSRSGSRGVGGDSTANASPPGLPP